MGENTQTETQEPWRVQGGKKLGKCNTDIFLSQYDERNLSSGFSFMHHIFSTFTNKRKPYFPWTTALHIRFLLASDR